MPTSAVTSFGDPDQYRSGVRATDAPAGPFYLIPRNYAPVPAVAAGLQNLDTFQGPPPVMPVG
jgi:hypothetical protein